jgi:hypothetical protein
VYADLDSLADSEAGQSLVAEGLDQIDLAANEPKGLPANCKLSPVTPVTDKLIDCGNKTIIQSG